MKIEKIICAAITANHRLKVRYDQQERVIEPYLLGKSAHGRLLLSAYQVTNVSDPSIEPGWRSFEVSGLSQVKVMPELFMPRAEYSSNDPHFKIVSCSVPMRSIHRSRPDFH